MVGISGEESGVDEGPKEGAVNVLGVGVELILLPEAILFPPPPEPSGIKGNEGRIGFIAFTVGTVGTEAMPDPVSTCSGKGVNFPFTSAMRGNAETEIDGTLAIGGTTGEAIEEKFGDAGVGIGVKCAVGTDGIFILPSVSTSILLGESGTGTATGATAAGFG